MVKSEESEKKSKEIETYVGVDQVRQFQFNIIIKKS